MGLWTCQQKDKCLSSHDLITSENKKKNNCNILTSIAKQFFKYGWQAEDRMLHQQIEHWVLYGGPGWLSISPTPYCPCNKVSSFNS